MVNWLKARPVREHFQESRDQWSRWTGRTDLLVDSCRHRMETAVRDTEDYATADEGRPGSGSSLLIANGVLVGVQMVYLSTVSVAVTAIAAGSAVLVVALSLRSRRRS